MMSRMISWTESRVPTRTAVPEAPDDEAALQQARARRQLVNRLISRWTHVIDPVGSGT